jgi:hypothetical protein
MYIFNSDQQPFELQCQKHQFHSQRFALYCGMAPKGRSIERPLLINGYASSSGFIGNDCESTQRPLGATPQYQEKIKYRII